MPIIKGVLRRDLWKYKDSHFSGPEDSSDSDSDAPPAGEGRRCGFERELNKCLHVSKEVSDLEVKYEDVGRFNYTYAQLENYEQTKAVRDEERRIRREETERQVKAMHDKWVKEEAER